MKALITTGGRGTRLRPITHTSNKHLIPIANKPMIHYAVESVVGSGITEVGIIINPETGDEMKGFLGDGKEFGCKFTYILQDEPLGLAHVVKISEDFVDGDDFIFYLGDNVIVGGIKRFIEEFEQNKFNCQLVMAKVKDPERFGVPTIIDGKITKIVEKPINPESSYAVTGIYIYDQSIFKAVNSISPSLRGELEISDAHQYLIENNYSIGSSYITGWWKDTGKPEDLLEANRLVLDQMLENSEPVIKGSVDDTSDIAGKVLIEEGATIVDSQVRGPAIIGKDATIINSYVGPFTSIANDCEIVNSEVEYSIVLEKTKILDSGQRIERSLLGREVIIMRCTKKPKTLKFIVGDQSQIELI